MTAPAFLRVLPDISHGARSHSYAEEVYAMPSLSNQVSRCCTRNATLSAVSRNLSKPLLQRLLGYRSPIAAERPICAHLTLWSGVDFPVSTVWSIPEGHLLVPWPTQKQTPKHHVARPESSCSIRTASKDDHFLPYTFNGGSGSMRQVVAPLHLLSPPERP